MRLFLRRTRIEPDWRDFPMPGGARFSLDKKHRLVLWRRWDESLPMCVFVMLNPSTADHAKDDPTSRRCAGFAQRWYCGGYIIVNVFSYRATDPCDLMKHVHTAGRHVDDTAAMTYLEHVLDYAGAKNLPIVCGWGASISGMEHLSDMLVRVLITNLPRFALKVTKTGHPGHPLYIGYDKPLLPFVPSVAYGTKLLDYLERDGDDGFD